MEVVRYIPEDPLFEPCAGDHDWSVDVGSNPYDEKGARVTRRCTRCEMLEERDVSQNELKKAVAQVWGE